MSSVGPAPGYLKTTCIDGPIALPYGPVAQLHAGSHCRHRRSTAGSRRGAISWPATATPINGTCVVGPPTQDAAFFIYTCTRPPANNQVTPVASCGPDVAGTAPNWITTTCTQPPGPTNFASTPSLPCTVGPPVTDASFVTTTCTKPIDTAGYAPGAVCVASDGLTPPYLKVTCGTPEVLGRRRGAERLVHPGHGRRRQDGCPRQRRRTQRGARGPVQTCVERLVDRRPELLRDDLHAIRRRNNQTVFTTAALCGTPGITVPVAAPWITTDCRKPAGANNATVFADPRFCINDPGTAPPYLKVDLHDGRDACAPTVVRAGDVPDRNHVSPVRPTTP